MPSAVQAHSKAIFRDSALGAALPSVSGLFWRNVAADVALGAVTPGQYDFRQPAGYDEYLLMRVAPTNFVRDVDDSLILSDDSAVARFVDDGNGGGVLSTNLSRAPMAELLPDGTGTLWMIGRTRPRLGAAKIGGQAAQLY